MATFSGVGGILSNGASVQTVSDALVALNRSLTWQMENLDSDNVREIGGWNISQTSITSRNFDVGMSSSYDQPENVRFWAGNTDMNNAPFRVYDSGRLVASNAQITGGTISWGAVGAPLYSDIQGTKPPSNADNTDSVITVNGSNFTKVAGAYVYSGPANYSQISGGPPSNADNTASALPSSLGINFTQIGPNYIYTGELNANKITAGTLNANYINGGALTGLLFRTNTVGRRIEMDFDSFRSYDSNGLKRISIENSDPSWGNHNIVWYDETGGYAGSIAGFAQMLLIGAAAAGEVVFSSPGGIRLATGTGAFDFNNVEVLNFAGAIAKFG